MVQKLRQAPDIEPVRKKRSGISGTMSYEEFRRVVETEPEHFRFVGGRRWARKASDDDILQAATDMLALSPDDYNRILCYLSVFTLRSFQLDPSPLIAWAGRLTGESPWAPDHVLIPEKMIPLRAFVTLRQIAHEAVRSFALDWIEQRKPLNFVIDLFERNYHSGDWAVIAVAVQREMDREALHSAGMGVHRVFQEHPDLEAVPALRHLIEHGPCSSCRLDFMQALRQLDELPELLQVEAQFDSNEDIRAWTHEVSNL